MDFLGTMFIINTLWILCSLPLFTAGASTAAMCHTYFRLFSKRENKIYRTFFEGFRSNFRQATVIWLIYLFLMLDAGLIWWTQKNGISIPGFFTTLPVKCIAAVTAFLSLSIFVFIFGLAAYYDCTVMQSLINAMGLSMKHIGWTVFMILLLLIMCGLIMIAPFTLLIAVGSYGAVQCSVLTRLFAREEALHAEEQTSDTD